MKVEIVKSKEKTAKEKCDDRFQIFKDLNTEKAGGGVAWRFTLNILQK